MRNPDPPNRPSDQNRSEQIPSSSHHPQSEQPGGLISPYKNNSSSRDNNSSSRHEYRNRQTSQSPSNYHRNSSTNSLNNDLSVRTLANVTRFIQKSVRPSHESRTQYRQNDSRHRTPSYDRRHDNSRTYHPNRSISRDRYNRNRSISREPYIRYDRYSRPRSSYQQHNHPREPSHQSPHRQNNYQSSSHYSRYPSRSPSINRNGHQRMSYPSFSNYSRPRTPSQDRSTSSRNNFNNDRNRRYVGMLLNSTIPHAVFAQPFDSELRCPIIQAKIGQWNGPVLIDTGSTTTFVSTYLLSSIGSITKPCLNNEAESISGSVKFNSIAHTTIELLGNVFLNFPLHVATNASILNTPQFNAIIGSDLLGFLDQLFIDWKHGRIHSQNPYNLSATSIRHTRYHLVEDVALQSPSNQPNSWHFTESAAAITNRNPNLPEIWTHLRQSHHL